MFVFVYTAYKFIIKVNKLITVSLVQNFLQLKLFNFQCENKFKLIKLKSQVGELLFVICYCLCVVHMMSLLKN